MKEDSTEFELLLSMIWAWGIKIQSLKKDEWLISLSLPRISKTMKVNFPTDI